MNVASVKGCEEFPSKCALFVCNKWDSVLETVRNSKEEAQKVKNHIIEKLQKCWPGLVPESQVIFISTKNATEAQTRYGVTNNAFHTLMDSIRFMVLKSIDARLEIHFK